MDLLACPGCRRDGGLELSILKQDGAEVWEGQLDCLDCGRTYPIHNGIPRFSQDGSRPLEERQTIAHFENEFAAIAAEDRDLDPPELLDYFFFSRAGLDPELYERTPGDFYRTSLPVDSYQADSSFLAGKSILDGGCGPGRFTRVVATSDASYVVGLDIGPQVERAKARCADLDNVDFVQGSVLSPPFKTASFDYAFSIGVLHHTIDPKGGVLRIGDLVKRDGAMSIWVYSPDYWGNAAQAAVGRFINRRVASMSTEKALRFCARWLYPLGRLQMLIARNKALKYLLAPLFLIRVPRHPRREVMLSTIYDYFGPAIISTHSYTELRGWLEEAGFKRFYEVPVPSACFARR